MDLDDSEHRRTPPDAARTGVEWMAQSPARAYLRCNVAGCDEPLPILVSVRLRASGGLQDLAAAVTDVDHQAIWDHMLAVHGPALE